MRPRKTSVRRRISLVPLSEIKARIHTGLLEFPSAQKKRERERDVTKLCGAHMSSRQRHDGLDHEEEEAARQAARAKSCGFSEGSFCFVLLR